MKLNLKHPFFLYLLPLFFVFHGYTENYDYIPIKDAALLTVTYLGFALTFSALFWLLYRDIIKAALISSLIMGFHFFFGSIHDAMKKIPDASFLTKYSFILPATLLFFVATIVLLKRKKKTPTKLSRYLNLLFTALILIDAVVLGSLIVSPKEKMNFLPKGFIACPDCPKPDIYYIVLDEYAGQMELTDIFNFNNSPFIEELKERGFHTIANSRSNYYFTPYSIASTLNMDYLTLGNQKIKIQSDLAYCYETIQNSKALQFLKYNQYQFYNYSSFDFDGQPAKDKEAFFPSKTKLITSQTFVSRFNRDIRYHLVTDLNSEDAFREALNSTKNNNQAKYNYTLKIATVKTSQPKFIFTHLEMPHYPYFFDKEGKERPFSEIIPSNNPNQKFYIEYLQYANTKTLELIDHIVKNSATPPIIILNSDHGFRIFDTLPDHKYLFSNLASIYLPEKNYDVFPDSLTNVNLFRYLFNNQFKQHLLLLADSSYLLTEQ